MAEGPSDLERARADAARLRHILDVSPNLVFINQLGRIVYANRCCEEATGYTGDELTSPDFDFMVLVAPESREQVQAAFRRHMEGMEVQPYEYVFVSKSGRRTEAVNATHLIEYEGEQAILGFVTDLTAREQMKRELRASEQRYRQLVETCPDAIVFADLDGRVVMANEAAARLRGFASVDELVRSGGNALDAVVPEQRERARKNSRRILEEGRAIRFEHDLLDATGERTIPVEVTASVLRDPDGSPTGFVGVLRDLTEHRAANEERRRLEAQVQHAQRLESLGVLAGGIAHDFNNILVGVLGNASMVMRELPQSSPARPYAEQITAAAQRAAGLTEQMLAYSGGSRYKTEPLHLAELVAEMAHLLEAAIPKGISLEYDFSEDVPPVLGDRGRLQQVAMNLITNAAEAMQATGGVVRIRVASVPGSRVAATHPLEAAAPVAERDYVCLAVEDTGTGMDEQTRERMFEPFFTTKFTGRGLGLAAVVGIVRGHDGCLSVETAPAVGTRFSVFIPAVESAEVEEVVAGPPLESMVCHGGTVLVVDDEELVRRLAEQVLSASGYRVLTACDGAEALEIARRGGLDVVVLDLTMPRVGGLEALASLREIRPGVPIVLSSGYSESEVHAHVEDGVVASFVKKPYRPEQLVVAVAKALRDGA